MQEETCPVAAEAQIKPVTGGVPGSLDAIATLRRGAYANFIQETCTRVCMHVCLPSKKKIRRGGGRNGECFILLSLSLSLAGLDGCSTRGTLQLHRTRKASLMGSRIGTGYFIYLQKYRLPVARSRSVFPTGAGRVRFFSNSRVSFPRPSLNIHSCRS